MKVPLSLAAELEFDFILRVLGMELRAQAGEAHVHH